MRNDFCHTCKHAGSMINGAYCLLRKQYVEYSTNNECDDYEEKQR